MAGFGSSHRFRVIIAFALVYLFWGSTYLAIGISDREKLPPLVMCATRFLIAGPLMLAACAFLRKKVALSRGEFLRLAVIASLLLLSGNTLLVWAEQYVATGLASLIVAITPIWMFVLDAFVFRGERTSMRGVAGLALGVVGTCILLFPDLQKPGAVGNMQLWGSLGLIFGSLTWALGSVLSRHWRSKITVDPITATGWEMTIAGTVHLLLAFIFHYDDPIPWTPPAIGAVVYLVICGSWIGFTAYVWLLKHVPTSKVATYAYVNPIVAVLLGWLVLDEKIDRYIIAGSVVIIAAVALVTSSKGDPRTGVSAPAKLAEVESAGD